MMLILHKAITTCRTLRRCYSVTGSTNILKLRDRGLLQDIFPAACPNFSEIVSTSAAAVYAGFDPTADSLHVGNLLVAMAMLHCQRSNHQLIAVVGGATAQLGDPTGRANDRPALDARVVAANAKSIESDLRRIFENHEKLFWHDSSRQMLPVKFLNNLEWYDTLNTIEFFSFIGQHFRIGPMLSKRSVQARLEDSEGMNFKEFTYQTFQAYDWLHLFQNHNCAVQLGGVDQLGNISAGYDLISRVENKPVYGFMVPLITNESGNKFGKSSEGDVVWLNSEKTSHCDFYRFFLDVRDSEVEKYLKLFTFLPLTEIASIMQRNQRHPNQRIAQNILASNVTRLVHGNEGLNSAKRVLDALSSESPEALFDLSETEMRQLFNRAPITEVLLHSGMTVLEMGVKAGCFPDEVDAQNTIKAGGFYVNRRRVVNPEYLLVPGEHILPSNLSLLRCGKRKHYVVKWV